MPRNTHHRVLFKYHPEWGYSFRNGIRVRCLAPSAGFASYWLTTNEAGFRSRHDLPPRDGGSATTGGLLLLGCSFTAGDGVGDDDRYCALLEDEHGRGPVHNLALSGSGNDQQALIAEFAAGLLSPDIVVLAPFTGCAHRNLLGKRRTFDPLLGRDIERPKPYFELEGDALELRNVPVPRWSSERDEASGSSRAARLGRWTRRIVTTPSRHRDRHRGVDSHIYAHPARTAARLTSALCLRALGQFPRARRVVMPIPGERDFRGRSEHAHRDFFAMLARQGGAEHVDLAGSMNGLGSAERASCYLPGDGHLSPRGHRFVAAVLAAALARGS